MSPHSLLISGSAESRFQNPFSCILPDRKMTLLDTGQSSPATHAGNWTYKKSRAHLRQAHCEVAVIAVLGGPDEVDAADVLVADECVVGC